MEKCRFYFPVIIFYFVILHGHSQSFIKNYTDLHSLYEGTDVLPIDYNNTAVLGTYYGVSAFATVVDSIGNQIYSNTNYPKNNRNDVGSNLTKTTTGFIFYDAANSTGLSGNDLAVIFTNDSLRQVYNYTFQYGCYLCNSANVNLFYLIKKGVFLTGTVWGINENNSPWRYNAYYGMITKLDSNGNQIWSNKWGPWDSANPCQVFNSIITTDSAIAVMGVIYDTIHLKKYNFNGNQQFDYKYSFLQNNVSGYAKGFGGNNAYGKLIEVNKNILAFGILTDNNTQKYQLALEIINLKDSLIAKKKYILYKDTANITPKAVYVASGNTAVLNYSIAGSTLNYYLIVDFKGDSISSFTLPAYTVSVFDNGNYLCALDSNKSIIVREYTPAGKIVYKYAYHPFDSLNVVNDIKPLTYPGRFVLTGSSNNELLIIRQDTSRTVGINNIFSNQARVAVYPNPSNGRFTLSLLNFNEKCSVEVYNVMGQNIYSAPAPYGSNMQIELDNAAAGMYLCRVIKETGELVGEVKFVIEK